MRTSHNRLLCTVIALGGLSLGLPACKVTVGKPQPTPPPAATPAAPPPSAPTPPPFKPKLNSKMSYSVNKRGEVELPGPILFEKGTATLLKASDEYLEMVQEYLTAKPEVTKLRIEGHTDTDGEDAANFDLSKRRAMSVVGWLVAKGIDCKRLVPVGFGEKKLKVPDDDEAAKEKNRRVVFVRAEVDGTAEGGLPVDGGEPGQLAGNACD